MMGDPAEPARPDGRPSDRGAETVSNQIEKDIIDTDWPVGKVIGSERELIERYGVSRAVFREAVRLVEHHQVARMRRGPGGGLVVTEPDPEIVRNAARLYLRRTEVRRDHLLEARAALELAAVASATAELTEPGIGKLTAVLHAEEELHAQGAQLGYSRRIHATIARLSGNPALDLFVEVLARLDENLVHEDWESHGELTLRSGAERPDQSHQAHTAIVEAMIAGDSALAQHRMRRHLHAIAELLD
jgi:DNA-binding FadR family transcriptional regulator